MPPRGAASSATTSAFARACRSASRSVTLREPLPQGSAAPSASWRNSVIAVAFAASAAARSRSLRTRCACTIIVPASATRSMAIAPAAATPPLCRDASFLHLVHRARRMREDRPVREVPFDVIREVGRALVTPGGVLLERLLPDRPKVRVQRRPARRLPQRARRRLADRHDRLHDRRVRVVRLATGEDLVEENAERVDVGAEVDVPAVAPRLLRAHVRDRSLDRPDLAQHGRGIHVRVRDAREAEVEDLHLARLVHDQVRRLEVPVDHAALVRMVHGARDRDEELEPFSQVLPRRAVSPPACPSRTGSASCPRRAPS